ncbi:hypothetical protein ADK74_16690 [Streptomyces decoyicus]|nr:hypothetical protein [Streptomyces decoyicus]KOG42349.1 hypothetical protein ADK74_16690 [Streptomyces decoyicus]QZY20267.1 hypothetical protein K7C20_00750 [Streptomyces decoyicus]
MSSSSRFRDPQRSKYSFLDAVLVQCPKCAKVAHVVPAPRAAGSGPPTMFDQRSLVCRSCGLSRQSRRDNSGVLLTFSWGSGPIADPYFQLPLWLQTETRHGRIWAYNPEHLEMIRQFVQAPLRERAPWYESGKKMTFIARLPGWMKRAKNRTEALRAIDRIRTSLAN